MEKARTDKLLVANAESAKLIAVVNDQPWAGWPDLFEEDEFRQAVIQDLLDHASPTDDPDDVIAGADIDISVVEGADICVRFWWDDQPGCKASWCWKAHRRTPDGGYEPSACGHGELEPDCRLADAIEDAKLELGDAIEIELGNAIEIDEADRDRD